MISIESEFLMELWLWTSQISVVKNWKHIHAFLEHFEIFSEYRSLKYGSEIIADLFRDYSHIILEAEPETLNNDAQRRIDFYKRNGFRIIDEQYIQPSYGEGKSPLNLWLLANWQPEKLDWIKEEIYDIVYRKL